jgi:hypothetical protein
VLGHNEDALAWLRIIAEERANLAQLPEKVHSIICAGTCVIRILRLLHLLELHLELADERQDAYSVGEHGDWVSLGHAFIAEDKDGLTVIASEHEYRPVFVAVEYKPGPGRPLVPDPPQHCCDPILLFRRIGRMNEQESPIFFCLLQIPEGLHCMDAALYTCFETSAELVNSAGLLGFSTCHKEEDFGRCTAPSFGDARAFIQGAKPP